MLCLLWFSFLYIMTQIAHLLFITQSLLEISIKFISNILFIDVHDGWILQTHLHLDLVTGLITYIEALHGFNQRQSLILYC